MTDGFSNDGSGENVTMVQVSASSWHVVISETGEQVGSIEQAGEAFVATDARGSELGGFGSPELAMFGVVAAR
ncbi:hypothetical protein [Herbiconiux liangxiaofengii]|uniref:hypothetical protein n=1 Tax=Herbiconiux liangxiaofengii TaxID=3342795 RepID=UPI0035BA648E